MSSITESDVLSKQGMIRLWLVEMGWMNQLSTAVALETLKMEIGRNVAIVGDTSEGSAEKSSNDVISSEGLNLINISHNFKVD